MPERAGRAGGRRRAAIDVMASDRLGPELDTSASARVFLSGDGWGYGVEVVTPAHGARSTRCGWGGGTIHEMIGA